MSLAAYTRRRITEKLGRSRHQRRSASQAATPNPFDECIAILRRSDNAAVLQIPFFPPQSRGAFVALRAFNAELAGVNEAVSSGKPLIGQMRFQWWKEAIKDCYDGRPPPNPVVIALAATIQKHRLSRYHFQRLIETRERYFLDQSFGTLGALAAYAQGTMFPLLSLILQAQLSSTPAPSLPLTDLDHALSHLSHTLTFSTLLHALPFHASRRVNPLPRDLCAEAGLSEEALFRRGGNAEGVRETVEEVARLAWGELGATRRTIEGTHEHGRQGEDEKGRGAPVKLSADVLPVFLAATPAKAFLDSLAKVGFDAMAPSLQKRPWKLPFQIWRDSFLRRL